MTVPIALFAFNRPDHLQRTLTALAANDLALQSALTIFCDGPRHAADDAQVAAVRACAQAATGFAAVNVIAHAHNKGLACSIIEGVTSMLGQHERIIVLEDDLVTSPYFLRYMHEGLAVYANNPHVASIHGWCFPHTAANPPETFFLRGADCWGWGTWRRAWRFFEPDGRTLLDAIRKSGQARAFDCDGAYPYTAMLEDQIAGRNDSWAIRWRASAWLREMYTVYPSRTLVENIGFDGSGTHCKASESSFARLSTHHVVVSEMPVQASTVMHAAEKDFFLYPRGKDSLKYVIRRKIGRAVRNVFHTLHNIFLKKY